MYIYSEFDKQLVKERAAEFRRQTLRFLDGQLSDEAFRPLRLQNGLYIQRHAPMLRIAIPYGIINSAQLRQLGAIAKRYDKGYGHITTRQNIQLNWVKLEDVPDILDELTEVDMHAIQTSGNCIRNVTIDPLTDISPDAQLDVSFYAEIIRQWSTQHPEFLFLPRKFKIALNAAAEDRAAIAFHDIGIQVHQENNEVVFDVYAGGGLGRTPIVGKLLFEKLPEVELLNTLEAMLRVYNEFGRRDNKYKARIKILVKALGVEKYRDLVEQEKRAMKVSYNLEKIKEKVKAQIPTLTLPPLENYDNSVNTAKDFQHWLKNNVFLHKVSGYAIVNVSLKAQDQAPGDISTEQMLSLADLADQYSYSELRTTHRQNIVLPFVKQKDLFALYQSLNQLALSRSNLDKSTDIICCPGGEYCSLANAVSIPVAKAIDKNLVDSKFNEESIAINISGCMNACGHHHIGGIGILGVDKDGKEWYQISIGGSSKQHSQLGKIIGPSFPREEVAGVVNTLIKTFHSHKTSDEQFVDTVNRIGIKTFKEAVYASV